MRGLRADVLGSSAVEAFRGVPFQRPRAPWWWGLLHRGQSGQTLDLLAREFAQAQAEIMGRGSPPMNGLFCDWLTKIHEGKQVDAPTFHPCLRPLHVGGRAERPLSLVPPSRCRIQPLATPHRLDQPRRGAGFPWGRPAGYGFRYQTSPRHARSCMTDPCHAPPEGPPRVDRSRWLLATRTRRNPTRKGQHKPTQGSLAASSQQPEHLIGPSRAES